MGIEAVAEHDFSGLIKNKRNPYKLLWNQRVHGMSHHDLCRTICRDQIKKIPQFKPYPPDPLDYYGEISWLQYALVKREESHRTFSLCAEFAENQIERQSLFDLLDKLKIDIQELKSAINEKLKTEIYSKTKEKRI